MMSCALIVCMAAIAAPQAPAPAKERTSYIITTPDGEFPVFWDERQVPEGADWVRVEVDEPWNPQIRQWKLSLVTVERRERPATREQRIKKGYEEHGYVEVNGRFVPQAEAALAERARAMAAVKAPSEDAAPSASQKIEVTTPVPEAVQGASRQGFFKRWAPHAGVVVIAGLLLLLVARTLLK